MSFTETPSGSTATAALVPETKDSAHGSALTREISIAHSPDSDDAFMFYALATNKVRVSRSALHAHPLRHRNLEPESAARRRCV